MSESSGQRPRALGGMTAQTVALVVCVLAVGALIGLAVLDWLEHLA